MDPLITIPIILSIGPAIIVSVVINDKDSKLWFSYIFGMAGWYIALMFRIPLLLVISFLSNTLKIITGSIMAGLFEEPTRFFILRHIIKNNKDPKIPVSLGLGWGLSEAFIIYVVNVVLASEIYGYTWIDFLPGALERNTAIIFHTAMAMLLGYSIAKNKRVFPYLLLAIMLHGLTNVSPYLVKYYLIDNVWFIEILLLVIVLAIALPIIHKYRSMLVGKQ